MRLLVVVAALLLWASPTLAEQKPAPDGFGPIKFGMTKDKSWAAIGGQGRWENEEILVHEVGIPSFMEDHYEVRQKFVDGRAAIVKIQNKDDQAHRPSCASHLAYVLGSVQNKYDIYPAIVSFSSSFAEYSIYHFHFRNNAMLRASFVRRIEDDATGLEEKTCTLRIEIAPPDESLTGGF